MGIKTCPGDTGKKKDEVKITNYYSSVSTVQIFLLFFDSFYFFPWDAKLVLHTNSGNKTVHHFNEAN